MAPDPVNFPSPAAPGNRALFLLTLILALTLTIGARTPSFWIPVTDVTPRVPATLVQHAVGGTDGSATLGPSDPEGTSPTVVAWPIALTPRHTYAISFSARNVGRQAIEVATDLQGTNYDSPEQEFASSLPPDGKERTFHAQLDAGDPPPDVRFRFFYKDNATVEVRNVAVLERPGYWKWLGRLGWLLAAAALGWLTIHVAATWMAPNLVALRAQPRGTVWLSLVVGLVSSTGLLTFMSWLGQPQIFSDEFVYAYLATHFGQEAGIATSGWVILDLPNRLFLGLYHALPGAAADPYAAARAINVVFVLAAFAALLECARRARGGIWSWIAALAGVIGPATTYASYFMPEAAFIALLYWLIIFAAEAIASLRIGFAAVAGALAACLILVKPHGVVPTVIVGAVMVFAALRTSGSERQHAWLTVGAFAVVTYAIRALLVRLLAPEGAIDTTLTGAFYADVPARAMALLRDPMRLASLLKMLGAHILVTLLLAAPAILAAIQLLPGYLRSRVAADPEPAARYAATVLILTVMVCVALMGMTAIYTVAFTGEGAFEVPNRLHLRYYAFCLPLIVVAFACIAHLRPQSVWLQYLHFGLWLIIAAVSIGVLPAYVWHIADAPDLFLGEYIRRWVTPLLVLVIAATFLVVSRIWFRMEVASVFVLSYVALGAVTATAVHLAQLHDLPQDADRVGRVAATVARGDRVPLLVVGNDYPPDVFRIGAYALERAEYVQHSAAAIARKLATLPPRTVIAGSSESLRRAGLPPMIQFGAYGIAQASAVRLDPTSTDAPSLRSGATAIQP